MTNYLYLTLNGEEYKIKDFDMEVENEMTTDFSGLMASSKPTGNVYVEITGEEV